MTSRRRFKTEFNRYLSNVNLNFLPPMPRPVPPKKVHFASNYVSTSNMNFSNNKISNKSFNNNYTDSNDNDMYTNTNNSNRVDFINRQYQHDQQQQQQQQQRTDNFTNQNMMTRSDDFY